MSNNVGRLGVVLGLDTAQFVAGLDNAGKMLEKFGNAVEKYGKAGVAAMVAAGVQALHYADELNDVAKANETTIASVIKLQQALVTNGGEAENAGKILASFTKYVDEAAQGSMEAQKRLATMGITLKDIATLGTQDLFEKALTGSANTADTITRNANAFAVFGKAIKGTDIKGIAEDFNAANPILKEQGENIEKAAEAWDALKKNSLETQTTIASSVGPSILALIELIKELKGESNLLGEAFRISFETIAVLTANIATQFIDIGVSLNQTMLMFKAFVPGTEVDGKWSEWERKREQNFARYEAFVKKVIGNQDFVTGEKAPSYFEPHLGVKVRSQNDGIGRPVKDAYAKETAQLQANVALNQTLLDIEKRADALRLQAIDGDKTQIDLANVQIQLETQLANIAHARAQALANENLNDKEKSLINKEYNIQETRAREKAKTDIEFINNMQEKLSGLYAEQALTRQLLLDIDEEIYKQQLAAINMDKLEADQQANVLQLKKEIVRINQQMREDLEQAGLSQNERIKIIIKAEDERKRAIQAYQQTDAIVTRQYQDQLEAVKRLKMAQDEAYAFDLRRQILEQNKYHMRQDEIQLAEEEITSEQKIADLRRQQMEIQRTMGQGELANAETQRIENLITQEQSLSYLRKKAIKDEYERQQSFQYGWDEAFKNYTESAINAATLGAQTFNAAVGNMNSALDKFVDTGKFSFEDLTNSIIKDLIKIQLKAAAMAAYGDVGNSVVGFMSGLFGKRVGGPAPVEDRNFITSSSSGMTLADGGSPPVGLATLVGERGPELFIPKTAGTIIPNGSLASALGGGGQTINYNGPYIANMSAIDTQTGVQFLAKNKQTIWASYQSANRSVPVSR